MWAFPPEDGANLMLVCEIRKKNIKKFMLTHQDSNLERQNQNLLCYHYTMGQDLFRRRKISVFSRFPKIYRFRCSQRLESQVKRYVSARCFRRYRHGCRCPIRVCPEYAFSAAVFTGRAPCSSRVGLRFRRAGCRPVRRTVSASTVLRPDRNRRFCRPPDRRWSRRE